MLLLPICLSKLPFESIEQKCNLYRNQIWFHLGDIHNEMSIFYRHLHKDAYLIRKALQITLITTGIIVEISLMISFVNFIRYMYLKYGNYDRGYKAIVIDPSLEKQTTESPVHNICPLSSLDDSEKHISPHYLIIKKRLDRIRSLNLAEQEVLKQHCFENLPKKIQEIEMYLDREMQDRY